MAGREPGASALSKPTSGQRGRGDWERLSRRPCRSLAWPGAQHPAMPLRGQWAGREQVPWTPRPSSPTAAARTGGQGLWGFPRGQLQTQRPEGTLPRAAPAGVHGRPTVQALGAPRCWKLLPTIAGPILAAAQSRTGRGSKGAAWASGFLTADPSTSCRAWRTGARGWRGDEHPPSPPVLGPLPSPPHCLSVQVGTTPTSPPTEPPAPRPGPPPGP